MPELTNDLLRTLTMDALAEFLPACVWIDDCAAVVTRVKDAALVEVFLAGHITAFNARLLYVQPMTDPVRSRAVLCEAAALLTTWHHSVADQNEELERDHAAKLIGIRNHAVRLHQDGTICRGGLDRFLSQFELRPYCNRARISYTLCGHYDVADTDDIEAGADARSFLRPDLSGIGHVEDASHRFELEFTVTDLG
jgi:hypothetical protein